MNRAPLCAATDRHREVRRRARLACDRATQLWQQGEQARRNASSIRAATLAILSRERERMHQYWIDEEVAATERAIEYLMVPGRELYPDLGVLDPYLLAAADDPLYLLDRLVEVALRAGSADRVVVQLVEPGVGAEIRVDMVTEFGLYDGSGDTRANADGDEGARGVGRSVPLVTTTGRFLGVITYHYERSGVRIEEDRPLFDLVALTTVRAMQWHGVCRRYRVERGVSPDAGDARPLRAVG